MAYQTPLTIKDTLEDIARHRFVLPAIQRELVWANEPERMTRLFDSILRGYPIGTFLFWKVTPEQSKQFHFYEFMLHWHEQKHRHNDRLHLADPRDLTAILDGQQRLSTLNIGLYGSLAHKLPGKRTDSVDAYPARRLHVDLRFEPGEDDDVQYRFAFLSDAQVRRSEREHWYRVGDILSVTEPGEPIFEYVTGHDLMQTPAFRTLSRLWKAVHEDGVVSYFEEREQSLSKVLDIFVRVNSGGVVLTKSDLLLSIATAQFESRDAREQIHGLVDGLNATKPGFKFTKDLVLKSGLALTDISDVGFKVENFTAANMKKLDEKWDDVERALRIGVKLLSSFGFSESTLPTASVLIPLADYIHHRGLDESYVTSANPKVRADRALVRHWTLRTILKPGIWASGLDSLLRALHQVITQSTGGFPSETIEKEMARRGKSLAFDGALLDELVDTPYRNKRAFALLTLLFDWVDTRNAFHIDHVFPRSLATRAKLRDQGVDEADVEDITDRVERLGNLQLLPGPENLQKRAQLPANWARAHFAGPEARDAWLAGHDLLGLPVDMADFLPFYEQRRDILRARLANLLGARPDQVVRAAVESPAPAPLPSSDVTPPVAVARRHQAEAQQVSEGRSRRVHPASLKDLLDHGLLEPMSVLNTTYRGVRYEATVRPDGRLEAAGTVFDSPSQAVIALTGQAAVNGWILWRTEDGTRIADLRSSVPAVPPPTRRPQAGEATTPQDGSYQAPRHAQVKRSRRVTPADLLDAGVLTAGTVLHGRYRGQTYEVVVRSDGLLEADGQIYDSPSQAAALITGQQAVNGWAFWFAEDETRLADLRPHERPRPR